MRNIDKINKAASILLNAALPGGEVKVSCEKERRAGLGLGCGCVWILDSAFVGEDSARPSFCTEKTGDRDSGGSRSMETFCVLKRG